MERSVIIVSAVVGVLGLLSVVLGFAAEGSKLTASNVLLIGYECVYPENAAYALGICAAIFLLMAQITVSAVSGCCGCCKSRALPSENKRIIGVVCAVISWITVAIAVIMFLMGVTWNANVARETSECYVLKDGIFAGAAVLSLVTTALGVTSYIMLRTPATLPSTGAAAKPGQQPATGIAMGQPQFPPPPPPQGYGQPQFPPPQGYGQPQFAPPPAPQGYGQA